MTSDTQHGSIKVKRGISRVVFLLVTKFSQRDYHRFGFDIIRKRGYKVEAWETSPWFAPAYARDYEPPDPMVFPGHRVHYSLAETRAAVALLSDRDIIVDAHDLLNEFDLGQVNGLRIGTPVVGSVPVPQADKRQYFASKLAARLRHPLKSIHNLKDRIVRNRKKVRVYDFCLIGGNQSHDKLRRDVDCNTTTIKAHSFDYDRYLEEESSGNGASLQSEGAYAVFLDEDVPFHPDGLIWDFCRNLARCEPESYYHELNGFFSRFENQTRLEIIIAGHPRADYNARDNAFNGRKLAQGQTLSLVKHCTLVISHASTSLHYAVLYLKPVVLLDSDGFDPGLRGRICAMGSALAAPIINMTESLTVQLPRHEVDYEKYSQFKQQFIKETGTPQKQLWEIFCDYLDGVDE